MPLEVAATRSSPIAGIHWDIMPMLVCPIRCWRDIKSISWRNSLRTRVCLFKSGLIRLPGRRLDAVVRMISHGKAAVESTTPGYETQCWGGGLMQASFMFQGVTRRSVSSSPTRLICWSGPTSASFDVRTMTGRDRFHH
jgi:hypothetical protein